MMHSSSTSYCTCTKPIELIATKRTQPVLNCPSKTQAGDQVENRHLQHVHFSLWLYLHHVHFSKAGLHVIMTSLNLDIFIM